jgi:hypothetical protein
MALYRYEINVSKDSGTFYPGTDAPRYVHYCRIQLPVTDSGDACVAADDIRAKFGAGFKVTLTEIKCEIEQDLAF